MAVDKNLKRLQKKVADLEKWAKQMNAWNKKVRTVVRALNSGPGDLPPKPPPPPPW
jgi:hypothetical protein